MMTPPTVLKDEKGQWTQPAKAFIKELWKQGYSSSQIAKTVNATRNAILGILMREGMLRQPGKYVQQRQQRVQVKSAARHPTPTPKPVEKVVIVPKQWQVPPELPKPKDWPASVRVKKTSKPVPLISLEPSMCKWPIGDPKSSSFGYCGARRELGSSYCAEHRAMYTLKRTK